MEVVIKIETCNDCMHKNHTGAFTPGGAKPCCNHPHTVEMRGADVFKRVIPYKNVYEDQRSVFDKSSFHRDVKPTKEMKGIPTWCPLKNGKTY